MRKLSNNNIKGKANNRIDDLFRDVFDHGGFEVMINPTRADEEKGIDMVFEVWTKEKRHYGHFFTQNKGTQKPRVANSRPGFLSFSLSLAHANYYYSELHDPLLFLLCDVTTGNVYWYPIQLDTNLEKKIAAQRKTGKKTLTLEIDDSRIVAESRLKEIMNDIDESRRVQSYKHLKRTEAKADYKVTWPTEKAASIVEQVTTTLNLFEGIPVFPIAAITKIFPFTQANRSALQGDTLVTDNPELYRFFHDLALMEDRATYMLPDWFTPSEDTQKEVKHILDTFELHMILHLEYTGSTKFEKRRVCLHHLFSYGSCNCERCTFKSLELSKLDSLMASLDDTATKSEELRRAYTFYLIGNIKRACEHYLSLLNRVSFNKEPGVYLLCKYNLINLKQGLGYKQDEKELVKKINELGPLNFELDELIMPPHFLDIFAALKNNRFLTLALKTIDTALRSINRIHYSDQLGGSSVNNKSSDLIVEFMRAYNFIEYNLLVCNSYRDFEILVDKTLESALALHSLRNTHSSRYEHFSEGMLTMWIFHAETAQLQFLLRRYNVKKIAVEDPVGTLSMLVDYAQNLSDSREFIDKNLASENYLLADKLKKIISNLLLLLSRLEYDTISLNKITDKLLYLGSDTQQFFNPEHYSYFMHRNELDKQNLKKIVELCIKHRQTYTNAFIDALRHYADHLTKSEIDALFLSVLSAETINDFLFRDYATSRDMLGIIFLLKKTSKEFTEKFKEHLDANLQERFDASLFSACAIYDIVAVDEAAIRLFIDAIPDNTTRVTGHEVLSGKKEMRNYLLDDFINIMYKCRNEFTPEMRELSKRAHGREYYDWLMDLEGFDYSGFNPYWIMECQTVYYFDALRNSEPLMEKIKESLREDYIEGVARIYFNELIHQK